MSALLRKEAITLFCYTKTKNFQPSSSPFNYFLPAPKLNWSLADAKWVQWHKSVRGDKGDEHAQDLPTKLRTKITQNTYNQSNISEEQLCTHLDNSLNFQPTELRLRLTCPNASLTSHHFCKGKKGSSCFGCCHPFGDPWRGCCEVSVNQMCRASFIQDVSWSGNGQVQDESLLKMERSS